MGELEGWEPRPERSATPPGRARWLKAAAADIWSRRPVRQALLALALLAAVRAVVALPAYPGATARRAVSWAQHTNVNLGQEWRSVDRGPVGQWARATLAVPAASSGAAGGAVGGAARGTAAAPPAAAGSPAGVGSGAGSGRAAAAGAAGSGSGAPGSGSGSAGSGSGAPGSGSGSGGSGGLGHLAAPVHGRVAAWFAAAGQTGAAPRGAHPALDFLVPAGSPVVAVADGVVSRVGFDPGGDGLFALVSHGGGWQSLYALCGRLQVGQGQRVVRGQPVCLASEPPLTSASHPARGGEVPVRFGLLHGGRAVDPAPYLGLVPPHG